MPPGTAASGGYGTFKKPAGGGHEVGSGGAGAATIPDAGLQHLPQSQVLCLRAAQRTFDLAYMRTSLGGLCFSLLVLRLFQPSFQLAAVLYAMLSLGVGVAGTLRGNMIMQHYRSSAKCSQLRVRRRDSTSAPPTTAHDSSPSSPLRGTTTTTMTTDDDDYVNSHLLSGEELVADDDDPNNAAAAIAIPSTFITATGVVAPLALVMLFFQVAILASLLHIPLL
ncbi:unnamed protein product [Parajaminaea phylloscopi]